MTKRCTLCGQEKPATLEFFYRAKDYLQSRCKDCQKNYANTWAAKNPEKARAYERTWREANRDHINAKKRERRQKNPEEARARDRERNAHLRREVLAAYGGRCACCGESTPEFLAIDHVNGDGAAHRRQIGGSGRLAHWLKQQGFPREGFRLLCHNCNMARGFYGACPHERFKGSATA